ncbi:MAG: GNAT family N-acetyltransferase [Bacteroidia bacterium]
MSADTPPDIFIRQARPADADALTVLARAAFAAAFQQHYPPEIFDAYVDEALTVARFAAELEGELFYVAEVGGAMAGYAKLRSGGLPPQLQGQHLVELQRMYVLPAYYGRGVAAALMDLCEQQARSEGYEGLWLGVWEFNYRAQRFYTRRGFVQEGTHPFRMGTLVEQDWVMYKCF